MYNVNILHKILLPVYYINILNQLYIEFYRIVIVYKLLYIFYSFRHIFSFNFLKKEVNILTWLKNDDWLQITEFIDSPNLI